MRPSFAPVLQLIGGDGLPISRIAEELGISPQAASRTAGTLGSFGYVERVPNPADGRSRLLVLTPRGRQLVETGSGTIAQRQADYGDLVGRARVAQLVRDVGDLRRGLGLAGRAHPVLEAQADGSIGAVILVALHARHEIVRSTVARGHTGVRAAHHGVLAAVAGGGATASGIARLQRVSRQAISTTVAELEALGYVERGPDDHDRRGVVFTLTGHGVDLGHDLLSAVEGLESRYRSILGDARTDRFDATVADLDEALGFGFPTRPGPPAEDVDGDPAGTDGDARGLEELARRLRRRLGLRDSARLASLLGSDPGPVARWR